MTGFVFKFLTILSFLFSMVRANFIFFSLTKQLYVPGKDSSYVTINHQLNKLTPYVYDVSAYFILSQTTQYDQTNSVFDFFKTYSDPASFNTCYQSSVAYMNSLYDQYQPCQVKCQIPAEQQYLRLNNLTENIGNQTSESQSSYFIIDNSFYPCSKGVYQPELYLFEQINLSIESNSAFFILLQVGCMTLLQILIMLITYILIMFNKLHHQKTKLLKIKQQEDNKDVLKNFLHSKNNQ